MMIIKVMIISHSTHCHLSCGHGVPWTHLNRLWSSSSLRTCTMGQVTWGQGGLGVGTVLQWKKIQRFCLSEKTNYFPIFLRVVLFHSYCQTFSVPKDMWYLCVCVSVCVAKEFFLGLVPYNFWNLIVPWLAHYGNEAWNVILFLITIKTKPI